MMKIEYKLECSNCKLKGESFIIRGTNKEDVRNLMDLHLKKEIGGEKE